MPGALFQIMAYQGITCPDNVTSPAPYELHFEQKKLKYFLKKIPLYLYEYIITCTRQK